MGFFDSIGSVFNPSNFMGSSGNSFLDLMDPGNTFHTGASTRAADRQFNLEQQIALKNYEEQKRMNDFNIKSQQEAFDYQKSLNELQMEREDTATSRRVADLKAAGLSPTLAAGSAADTGALHAGSPPVGVAPHMDTPSDVKVQAAMFKEGLMKDRMQLAASLMGNIADISKTRAETQLLNAQTNQLNAWTPIDLKLKSQLYEFNEAYNPYRIEDAISKIQNTRADTFYKERQSFLVDAQKLLAMDEHGMNAFRQAGIVLDNSLKRANIDLKNQEYIKEAIAIELLRSQYQEYTYKQDWYHNNFGMPVDVNLSGLSGLPMLAGSIGGLAWRGTKSKVSSAFNTTTDFVSRTVEKAGNFLDSIGLIGILHRITGGAFDFSH